MLQGILANWWNRNRGRIDAPSPILKEVGIEPDAGVGAESHDLAAELLRQGRFALLLRAQLIPELTLDQRRRAFAALESSMCVVPRGPVLVKPFRVAQCDASGPAAGFQVEIESLYLDKYAVTNRDFLAFVQSGGYTSPSLWEADIGDVSSQFVDRSGRPGPRGWVDGTFAAEQADLPVTGVSWFEAAAYAKWVGKRLPTDPEWTKAATWPTASVEGVPWQRRYPWGNVSDRRRANLWGTGPGKVVGVSEFPDGANPVGVRQLIGNVWEWTASEFGARGDRGDVSLILPMKSIRGGAFDTYFETQATSDFQSGEQPIARKGNIGFRCALGWNDVVTELDLAPSVEPEAVARDRVPLSDTSENAA